MRFNFLSNRPIPTAMIPMIPAKKPDAISSNGAKLCEFRPKNLESSIIHTKSAKTAANTTSIKTISTNEYFFNIMPERIEPGIRTKVGMSSS